MICQFSDVSERDMDLLFLEEFACSTEFLQLFLSKIMITNATVVSLEHSKTDVAYGESDITVIIENDSKKTGLLIEDKIDAIAMPEQCSRYAERGKLGIKNGDYNEFFVFIVAPQKYLDENTEAKKYPYSVSYEECIEYFERLGDSRADFKLQQIKSAINKQKTGYQVIESKRATDFYKNYVAFQKEFYPELLLTNGEGVKGAASTWVQFATPIKKVHIIHKIENGYTDLEFSGYADRINGLREYLISVVGEIDKIKAGVFKTGKSAVLRIQVPKTDFDIDFKKESNKIKECLEAISILNDICYKLSEAQLESIT